MIQSKYNELIKQMYGVPEIFIREKQRQLMTGISRGTAWRMEKSGEFPKRIGITNGISIWSLSEILEWQDSIRSKK